MNIKIDMMRDRKQFVVFENEMSNCVNVDSGVAQGGSSSPVEFNTFKADMGYLIKSSLFEFADDSVLINIIYSEDDCLILQNDLNTVNDWCVSNGLELNVMKSKLLRVSLRKNKNINFSYTINDISIEQVNSHKHLGVFFDENLDFNLQCDKTVSKALQKWGLLKYMCKKASGDIFLRLYKTYILPILEFSCIGWSPNITQIKRIENVQRRVTKFICNKLAKFDIPYLERLKVLNMLSLEIRRKVKMLIIVQKVKMKNELIPTSWLSKFNFKDTYRYGPKIDLKKTRINFCDKSFFVDSSIFYNELPKEIREIEKINVFKNKITFFLNSI